MTVWPLPRITFCSLSAVDEKRPVALLTNDNVWPTLSSQLHLPVLIQAEPRAYHRDLLDYLANNLPGQVKVIYAVGGGAVFEAGKLIAARNYVPLVFVPTALDNALMFMPRSLVADKMGERSYLGFDETSPAAEIILDWDAILAAPAAQRGVGIVDVLSIVTGLLDWRYAAQKGKNPREQKFVPWAASVATDLAKQAIKIAPAVGQGDAEALRNLLDLMMLTVQLCNQLGHTRVQQGGEHILARIIASTSDANLIHAEYVGPCLLFVSALHGQDPAPLREAMQGAGVRLDGLRATDFNLVVDHLVDHLAALDVPYSILNDLDPVSERTAGAIEAAGMTILAETWEKPQDTQIYVPVDVSEEAPHEAKSEEAAQPAGSETPAPQM
jgi:glycerol dehydrogenase-like iron-containing ADH family enzyme